MVNLDLEEPDNEGMEYRKCCLEVYLLKRSISLQRKAIELIVEGKEGIRC
jgi:hypothetical protein